jgi:hypothetical protein
LLDDPFSFAAIANVAHPQSANAKQLQNIVALWNVNPSQLRHEVHPRSMRQADVVNPNGVPQRLDPSDKETKPLSKPFYGTHDRLTTH